ncbi:MAG: PilC/PilY family type IV pilus protein, partial [Betaproteobacteria bacterium]|nr:PilC/PilY family type IV pilus protein [Betaproteobacteria bacterium]
FLAIVKNAAVGKRIWDWAGTGSNELFSSTAAGAPVSPKYIVQVKACSAAFNLPDGTKNYRGENCKPYTDSKGSTVYKPVGVLHKFGENGSVLFGLLTGSYDTNTSGGVLRKVAASFADEVNPQTGQFTSSAIIVKTFDSIMIRGFTGTPPEYLYRNYLGYSSLIGNRIMNEGEFPDWGNPVGEMMFEALRYLGGAGSATSAFSSGSTIDTAVGLSRATWDKPYNRVPWCSRANLLVLSDINPSFDSDQLPGARFSSCAAKGNTATLKTDSSCTKLGSSFSGSFGTLNVGQLLDEIGQKEGINGKNYLIGQSGNLTDWAPTAKTVSSLSTIRGLAPEDPGKEGSYTSAAVAYYGRTVGIPTVEGKSNQKVDTWVVALASPLPKIEVPTPKGNVTIVPFGKSVAGYGVIGNKENFQPANQIIKLYVNNINPKDPANGGRYSATYLLTFEDVEQGSDHEMDFIVEYQVTQNSENNVDVVLMPKYQAAGIAMNVGYIISGAGDQDGSYLVVQNRSRTNDGVNPVYPLNVPDGRAIGYCDTPTGRADPKCATLPNCRADNSTGSCNLSQYSKRTFIPKAGGSAASLLKDPLWYAAKWGGFRDIRGNTQNWPDVPAKWDSSGKGQPDNYLSVQNPLALENALLTALSAISESGGKSSGQISTSSDVLGSSDTLVFSTTLHATSNPPDWSGDIVAKVITKIDKNNPSGIGPVRWKAAEQLPSASARRIFTRNNANLLDISSNGVEFKWAQLNTSQQTALTLGGKFNGSNILDYMRGSAENETAQGGNFRSRSREGLASSPLGDSPNNAPRYFKATNTVFLGANDGMLHAFDAATGKELFAYIPSALIPKLPELARPDYGHAWYADGEAAIGTVKENGKHMLVGALGRGGKGLFGLNVSDPAHFSASNIAWELNGTPAGQCGASPDHDNLGLILGTPIIGTFNDNKTYALVGNGYNSCNGKAALYVINIQTGSVVRQIEVPFAGNNGLSTPVTLDTNGDGKIDLVYAGDLLGNLWRFDLRSDKPAEWSIRFGSSTTQPMFTARFARGEMQPITAPPTVTIDGDGLPWVFFGTGRYLAISDRSDQTIQRWYGLMDDSGSGTVSSITGSQLVKRKFETSDSNTRDIQKEPNSGSMNNKRGWYIDFDIKADAGERVISAPLVVKTRRGTVVLVPSIIPSSDPCMAGGRGYINFVSAFTGAGVDFPFIDLNGDGIINDRDILYGSWNPDSYSTGSFSLRNGGMPGNLTLVGSQIVYGSTDGETDSDKCDCDGSAAQWGRISWREIIRE